LRAQPHLSIPPTPLLVSLLLDAVARGGSSASSGKRRLTAAVSAAAAGAAASELWDAEAALLTCEVVKTRAANAACSTVFREEELKKSRRQQMRPKKSRAMHSSCTSRYQLKISTSATQAMPKKQTAHLAECRRANLFWSSQRHYRSTWRNEGCDPVNQN
jgi:hypothetical protein